MALTEEQEAQLAALLEQRAAPEPRTETGLAGLLHVLLDVVSGAVPHLAPEVWAVLHKQAEALAEPPAAAEPEQEPPAGTEQAPE